MLHDPSAHQVRVDAVGQCDAGNGNVSATAFLNDLELILARIGAAAGAVYANAKRCARCARIGVHYLHGGHHLYGASTPPQEGADRTVTEDRWAKAKESISTLAFADPYWFNIDLDIAGRICGIEFSGRDEILEHIASSK